MVWECMSARGVGNLRFIEGIVNANKYEEILEEGLLPSIPRLQTQGDEYTFQQDGAACHTAKKITAWLQEKEIPVLKWPANSPDLSPIETLWGKMKKQLRHNPPRTLNELKAMLQAVWDTITPEMCNSLVDTMPRRLQAVIEKKGDATQR